MPRKRKLPLQKIVEEQDASEEEDEVDVNENSENLSIQNGPMYNIMSNVQLCETFHNKYIKETQQLYRKMDHDAFMFTFIRMVKSAMEAEENNEYAYTTLLFCAKYVSSYQDDTTHLVLLDIFKWITTTISNNPHIRYRLCQFVNIILRALGPEAALDDSICDSIMTYMITRLRDINPNVRVQAILALQRLQNPDNPDDIILKTYHFHLSSDPSPKVRMAVITSIGRNFNTIPYILERLWDIDEKVRRHTYLNMSSYPARSYKVAQRLTFLEQGLNDRSDMVRKVVTSVMLPQWLESYNKNFIHLISALKLDANETEIERFRKTAKLALKEMFKKNNTEELIQCLPIERDDLENEFYKCVTHEKLTIEVSIYWICLIEFLQQQTSDEIDMIIPELSTFCSYILKFCESKKLDSSEDKWRKMENQYILLGLIEIVHTFDLGDEIGRENLKQLLATLLKNHDINGKVVEMIVRCAENLITNQEDRLQFFVDIIKEITDTRTGNLNDFINNRNLIDELLDKNSDINLKLQITSLRVKILDLEEQERNYVDKKEYVKAQKITDEKGTCHDEYLNLLKPLLNQASENCENYKSAYMNLQQPKKITTEEIVKTLQISFYMIASKRVSSLTPNVCELYKNFIRRHIESNTIIVRNWALKCGTAYSMLYDQLAKDVYSELYSQFFKNQNITIWNTSIDCLFELIDRYGFDHFENSDKQNKNKNRRQLYNTIEFLDVDDDVSSTSNLHHVDVIFMMSHILDTCEDIYILRAIIKGMCRLVLHGHIKNDDIMEKLLLKYFNPATEPEINQILGMFYRNLIKKKKQEYLQPCLLPTINSILIAPYDSPLHEIKPDTVIKFVIDATGPQFCSVGLNIHNTIALSFMQEMQNNITNKELIKILSKELFSLEIAVSDDGPLRNDLVKCCEKLLENELDQKTATNIKNFKEFLNGNYREGLRTTHDGSGEDEDESDHETQATTETALSVITNSVTNPSETELTKDFENRKEIRNNLNAQKVDKNNKEKQTESVQLEILASINSSVTESLQHNPTDKTVVENQNQEKEIRIENINQINTSTTTPNESRSTISNKKDTTSNITQNISSVIPPLLNNNSTPRKTIINNRNETPHVSTLTVSPPTPTTFGCDNSTNMRYLRKSLNLRQTSHSQEDGPTMPPKIRIEAKIQANVKGIQEVPQPALEPQTSNNTDKQNPTTDDNSIEKDNEKDATNLVSILSSEEALNNEEIVTASPESVTNRHGKRQPTRSQAKATPAKAKTKSSSELLNNSKDILASKTPTRSSARNNKQNVSKIHTTIEKSNESAKNSTNKTPNSISNSEKREKTKPNAESKVTTSKSKISTPKTKTPSRPNKDVIDITQVQESLKKTNQNVNTRSASKRDHIINNIMTRNRLSSENVSKLILEKERTSRIPISKNTKVTKNKTEKTDLQSHDNKNIADETELKSTNKINISSKPKNYTNVKASNLPIRLRSNRIAQK